MSQLSAVVEEYHFNLEEVLAWMLGAEEQISDDDEDSLLESDVESVKQLFHAHEDFMLELTHYQDKTSDLLNEGQALIESNICTSEEQIEVQQRKTLLNSRWEELRSKATSKQTRLHDVLMLLQQKQLDNLRAWLITAEDKISNFCEIGPDLPSVRQQCEEHRRLQDEVLQQQATVNSLSNMVVIVDEVGNGNDINDTFSCTDDLEDQLVALSEKWAHVCRFVEERSTVLDLVARNWQLLEDEEIRFNQWISKLDKRLTEMEESAGETDTGSQFVAELIKRLQRMEKEMEMQHEYYSKIAEEGQTLLDQVDKGSLAHKEVGKKLERLTEVWDSTVQRMETLGIALTKAASLKRQESIRRAQVKKEPSLPKTEMHTESSSALLAISEPTGNGAKKRRLDSWKIKEWQRALEVISDWLGRIESELGLDDQEQESAIWDQLAIEEQQLLLEDSEHAIDSRKKEVEDLLKQGKQITSDLKSSKYAKRSMKSCVYQSLSF